MESVTISKKKFKTLKKRAEVNDLLLRELVEAIEDVRRGKIKLWKETS